MCAICENIITVNKVFQFDPTRTTSTRRRFVAELGRRFALLKKAVREHILEGGLFKRNSDFDFLLTMELVINAPQWRSKYDPNRIPEFLDWMEGQNNKFILSKGEAGFLHPSFTSRFDPTLRPGNEAWTNSHIRSAYQKGAQRARQELKKAGIDIPSFESTQAGLSGVFDSPFHMDRVRLAYTQTFAGLKGITKAMDATLSYTLAEGMARGDHPYQMAKAISGRIDAVGLNRAKTLARTEVIRAHHNANINELEAAGIEGVKVKAEWSTAGFNVCPICDSNEGREFTLGNIRGLIPAHPNCRCCAIPVVPKPKGRRRRWRRIRRPKASVEATETIERFTVSKGNRSQRFIDSTGRVRYWSLGRVRLHDTIIKNRMAKATPVDQPVSYMMGGGPASGKSSVRIAGKVKIPKNHILVDPDDLKKSIPEYNRLLEKGNMKAASIVHEESSFLSKSLMDAGVKDSKHVLLDGTGDGGLDSLTKKVARLRKGGRKIVANYVTVDTEVAVQRNIARALNPKKKRGLVPESYVKEVHQKISRIVPRAIENGLFDEFALWDTNLAGKVRLVAKAEGKNLTIVDKKLWKRFLAKGRTPTKTIPSNVPILNEIKEIEKTARLIGRKFQTATVPKGKSIIPFFDRKAVVDNNKGILKAHLFAKYGQKKGAAYFDDIKRLSRAWRSSSSNRELGLLKTAATKSGRANKTLYHGQFLDDDERLLRLFREQSIKDLRLKRRVSKMEQGISFKMDELFQTVYSYNQAILKNVNKNRFTLYRGSSVTSESIPLKGKMEFNSLSSWTPSLRTANDFGSMRYRVRVKREDLFSSWESGFGHSGEREVILFGKPREYTASRFGSKFGGNK